MTEHMEIIIREREREMELNNETLLRQGSRKL
jgi:hypothetical protein